MYVVPIDSRRVDILIHHIPNSLLLRTVRAPTDAY